MKLYSLILGTKGELTFILHEILSRELKLLYEDCNKIRENGFHETTLRLLLCVKEIVVIEET
jgi:hypothetical protein